MASKDASMSSAVRAIGKSCSKPRVQVISSKCAVWSCENNKKPSDSVTYFNLPTSDKGRCVIWLLNAGRIDLVNLAPQELTGYIFCENHFELSQFVQKSEHIRKLIKNAIPTLFGIAPALIPLHLMTPVLTPEEEFPIPPKTSSKPTSINACSAKCFTCSKSYKSSSDITLYFFPVDDPSRYFAWIINSGEVHLLQRSKDWVHHNCLLCSDHFVASQFEVSHPGHLRAGAIPTRFRGVNRPTIPAPHKFSRNCSKASPLVIKSYNPSSKNSQQRSPKISVVNTITHDSNGKSLPIKVKVPQVEVVNSKPVATPVALFSNKASNMSSSKENQSTVKTYSSILKKIKVPSIAETLPAKTATPKTPVSSTILIDASGKPTSDHPLANVISSFLAKNKGHTGDLLITDGTPNGVKYLIRQNRVPTAAIKDTQTSNNDAVAGSSPAFFVSPQAGTCGPTIIQSSVVSLSSPEKSHTTYQATVSSDTVSEDGKANSPVASMATSTTVKMLQSTGNPGSTSNSTKIAISRNTSASIKTLTAPNVTGSTCGNGASALANPVTLLVPVTSDGHPSFHAESSGNNPNPQGTVTVLLPVMPPTQGKASGIATQSPITNPVTLLMPVTPNNQVDNKIPIPATPSKTVGNNSSFKTPVSIAPARTYSKKSNSQPFTIVQKNMKSTNENGATTCKSTFVIRGNGPLSPAQLESIIKENLLNNGTIKDGAKILIRHKSGPQASKDSATLKNEAFIVKESKIVPVDPTAVVKPAEQLKTANTNLTIGAPNKKIVAIPPPPKGFSLNQNIPLFRYPKGVSPEKMAEMRRVIRKHQVKISRQAKTIERLKKDKKEKVKNLPPEQLAKMVRNLLPGFCGTFFESQIMTVSRDNKKHGHRWDDDTKIFALGLWNRSPAAFKLMQRAFNMPSFKTLTKWVTSVPPEVDFFQKLKEVLTKPVEEEDPFNDLSNLEEPKDESQEKPKDQEAQVALREGEVEPEGPHDQEPMFPDEEPMDIIEEDVTAARNEEDRAIIEKVCIDLDAETGMHIVEEVVDSGDVLVEQLIAAAANSSSSVKLKT